MILVDLDQHRSIVLLNDREAATLAEWLQQQIQQLLPNAPVVAAIALKGENPNVEGWFSANLMGSWGIEQWVRRSKIAGGTFFFTQITHLA